MPAFTTWVVCWRMISRWRSLNLFAGKGLLSLDVQGYLREVQGEEVLAVDWTEKEEALKYIHILKANEHEMEMLTQCADPYDAALKLAAWGVKEVLLTLGDKGSLIYVDNRFYEIPAYPVENVADATGCGDTYMAGYLYMRNKGASYQEGRLLCCRYVFGKVAKLWSVQWNGRGSSGTDRNSYQSIISIK